MSFDLARVENDLRLLDWQNEQLEATTAQLEAAFPQLQANITQRVNKMWTVTVGMTRMNPKPVLEELLVPWVEEQSQIALQRAEASLSDLIARLSDDTGYGGTMSAMLPALAGVGILAASAVAIPGVIAFATVTTTSFLIFSTSAISVPLLLVGGTVLAGVSLTGVKTIGYARDNLRSSLDIQLQALALAAIFGHGLGAEERCVLTDLQAMILKASDAELRGVS